MSKLQKAIANRPPRRWGLVAPAINGKTTFAMQMRSPMLFIDTDHRASASAHLAPDPDKVFVLPREDVRDVRSIVKSLADSVPGENIATLNVDSLTSIIKPIVNNALLDNMENKFKNKQAAFLEKGVSMSLLQDAVSSYGTDVLWIWHVETSNMDGESTERETLTKTEFDRLLRNLNAKLEIVSDGNTGRLGMKVENLRPRSGQEVTTTLWDDTGCWRGMPERIDAFLAGTQEEVTFKSKDEALGFAVKQGHFPDVSKAGEAYDEVKARKTPRTASEMFKFWQEHLRTLKQAA